MNFKDFRTQYETTPVTEASAGDPVMIRKLLRGAKVSVNNKEIPVNVSRVMKGMEIFNRTGKTQSIPKAIMPHYQAYLNRQQNVAGAFANRASQVREEVESVEESVATAQKVMDRANVVAKTNPDPKKRFAASGLARKAMLRTINPTGVNTGIVRGGGNKTYRMSGKIPPYQLTKKTGVSEEIELSEAEEPQQPNVIQKSVDPPPVIMLKRSGVRIFPDGRRVAVYTNSKLDLVFSVPYDAYHDYKPGAAFGGGTIPGVQVK